MTAFPGRASRTLDEFTWQRLQARLGDLSVGVGVPKNSNPWLYLIWCEECKQKLYILNNRVSPRGGKVYYYRYYRHEKADRMKCHAKMWADAIEDQIPGLVLRAFAGRYVEEHINLPGEDHSEELTQIEQAIADWEEKAVMATGTSAESVLRILDKLNTRRDALIESGVRVPARSIVKQTGEPLTDRWLACADDYERGALLRKMGYRIVARSDDGYRKVKVRLQQVRNNDARHWAEMVEDLGDLPEED